jgi:phage tail-like protein
MTVYKESLILGMNMDFSSDTYEPVQVDLMKLLPEKDADKELLSDFIHIFSQLTGEWLYKIKDIGTGLDPNFSGDNFISHLATIIGFPLFDEEGVPLADKRRQLIRAVDSYKQKGSYQGLSGMLRTVGIVSEIKDMFVKKEVNLADTKINYNDFDKHVISNWFVGDNPPALLDYFKTSHFYINILLTTLYNPGIIESLWNEAQERKLNSVLDLMRPINTWPYKNLFMEFYHSYVSGGGIFTYNPNIYSCYIDRRPYNCFKLNDETLEYINILDNDGFPVKNNDGEYIVAVLSGLTSAWWLNKGIKLNYDSNPERLVPQYYLLGKQNKPFYTFFDSFIDIGTVNWKDHTSDFSFYQQVIYDYGVTCKLKDGYLYIHSPSLADHKKCYVDLQDKNVIIQFKIHVDDYATSFSLQSYGCIAQRNPVIDTGVKYYIINDVDNNWLFKVEMFTPSGSYELLSQSVDTPSVGWSDVKIVLRGYYTDIYFNTKKIVENLYTGDLIKLDGWDYGSCFTFIATEFYWQQYDAKFKDLGVIRLGNQGQEFTFDQPERIISDNFVGTYLSSINGVKPRVSYYDELWSDINGIATYGYSNDFLYLDCASYPSTDAFIKLNETRLKLTFKFIVHTPNQAGKIYRNGCWLKGSEKYLKENLKIYVEYEYANSPRVKVVKYEEDVEKSQHTYLDEVINSNELMSDSYGSWNKFTVYLEEDRLKVRLNDYHEWSVSLVASQSPTFTMNEGTLFGFFVKHDGSISQLGSFDSLEIWRYGINGVKDVSSPLTLLEDNFDDVDHTLLKNHTSDINNTPNVWIDPDDAWKILGNILVPNTTDIAKILNSYINVGKRNVDIIVKFNMQHWTSYNTFMGIMVRGNSDSKKAFRYSLKAHSGTSSTTLKTELVLNGEEYYNLNSFDVSYLGPVVTLRIMFRKNKYSVWVNGTPDENYYKLSQDMFEDNLGYNVSLWWDPSYTTYNPSFTYLRVEETVDEEIIQSESDKIFGDLNIVENSPEKKYEFDTTVSRNLEFLEMSEVAFLAGDGKTVLGGATFPTVDKYIKETFQLKGALQYEIP